MGRLPGLRDKVSEGDMVIVDAESAEAYLRPRTDVVKAIQARIDVFAASAAAPNSAKLRDTPAFTRDGAKITSADERRPRRRPRHPGRRPGRRASASSALQEFQFMVAEEMPRFNAQTALYSRVMDAAGDLPVTFRTLDLGGDKVLPYMEAEREDNPALGWRAIRMGLDRPALLRLQLRALIAAARGRPLRIMFPLISNVDEFRAARAWVDVEVAWAQRRGRAAPSRLDVGAMIESLSLICKHLDALLPIDRNFVSVGTNLT